MDKDFFNNIIFWYIITLIILFILIQIFCTYKVKNGITCYNTDENKANFLVFAFIITFIMTFYFLIFYFISICIDLDIYIILGLTIIFSLITLYLFKD